LSVSSQQETIIFTLTIMIIIILFRVRRALHGTKISTVRTVGFSAFFLVVVFSTTSNSLLFGGVHILYSIPYVILLCTAAYVSYRYSNSTLSFWKSAEGSIYLKGGLIIYLIYIGVLIPRIMIEFIFVGPQGYLFINQAQQGVHLKATISSVE
jgi:hypothetical protein